jgi:hypothetical protein
VILNLPQQPPNSYQWGFLIYVQKPVITAVYGIVDMRETARSMPSNSAITPHVFWWMLYDSEALSCGLKIDDRGTGCSGSWVLLVLHL